MMTINGFIFMFKNLFDLRYERNLEEAFVFYFFYTLFAFFFAGCLRFYTYVFSTKIHLTLAFTAPFIFYTFIAISIFLRKNLKDISSIYLVFYTIVLTLFIPLGFAWVSFVWSNPFSANFLQECGMAFRVCFLFELILGGIPSTFLSTKEDCSLNKEIQKMEQEKLEHEQWIEKQLLTERAIASKLETIRKQENNEKGKEVPGETE